MIIVFPMGGEGGRFKRAGYTVPKPLIEVGGKPLIQWAVDSYQMLHTRHVYIVRSVDVTPRLTSLLTKGMIYEVSKKTSGPIDTLLTSGMPFSDEPLLIADCDSSLDPQEVKDAIDLFQSLDIAGGVTVRQTTDPNCSYAELSPEWWVQETREKDPFSPWSTTGPYWFASGHLFKRAAERALYAGHTSISPVYNYLSPGTRVKAFPVRTFHHLGTPEELMRFEQAEKPPQPTGEKMEGRS